MYAGRIVEIGPTRRAAGAPAASLRAGIVAVGSIGNRTRRGQAAAIPGEPPVVGALPRGCPFHPRCPAVMAICRENEPALERNGDAAVACWAAGPDPTQVAAIPQKPPAVALRRDDAPAASTAPLLVPGSGDSPLSGAERLAPGAANPRARRRRCVAVGPSRRGAGSGGRVRLRQIDACALHPAPDRC